MPAVFVNACGYLQMPAVFINPCEYRRGGIYNVYKLPNETPPILNPAQQYIRIP